MTETEVKKVKEKLHANTHGPLRKLFYLRNGLPKQGLKNNEDIYKALGIDLSGTNSLEKMGVRNLLGVGLSYLRKQAKEAKLGWIDWESTKERTWEDSNGEIRTTRASVAAHGFFDDIDKFIENAGKFEKAADGLKAISEDTSDISTTQIRRIRRKQKEDQKIDEEKKKSLTA